MSNFEERNIKDDEKKPKTFAWFRFLSGKLSRLWNFQQNFHCWNLIGHSLKLFCSTFYRNGAEFELFDWVLAAFHRYKKQLTKRSLALVFMLNNSLLFLNSNTKIDCHQRKSFAVSIKDVTFSRIKWDATIQL